MGGISKMRFMKTQIGMLLSVLLLKLRELAQYQRYHTPSMYVHVYTMYTVL